MSPPPSSPPTDPPHSTFPTARRVFRDNHFTILVEERLRVVITVRSDKGFTSLEELREVIGNAGKVLDGLGRSRMGLLVDVRTVSGRNDPTFEEVLQSLLPRWLGGFRKVGVLVRTTAGVLQIQRHVRKDGIERWPSTDEAALVKYLTE